jgi:hypothetical protein
MARTELKSDMIDHAPVTVASASTCDIGATISDRVIVSGTTTITSLGTKTNKVRFVHFSGALILTHNATSLILPTSANITTVAGDSAVFSSDGSGYWKCLSYLRLDGTALATSGGVDINGMTEETAPATGDFFPLYDASAAANRKMQLSNVLKVIASLPAEASPATDDDLLIYDTSETAANRMSFANFLKVVNSLTEDTAPTTSDFFLSYDTSAAAAKKVANTSIEKTMNGTAKAWAHISATGSANTTHNVSSVTDTGTGDGTVNLTSAMSATTAVAMATAADSIVGNGNSSGNIAMQAVSSTTAFRHVTCYFGNGVNVTYVDYIRHVSIKGTLA